jgi:hypothetical protein
VLIRERTHIREPLLDRLGRAAAHQPAQRPILISTSTRVHAAA